MTSKPGCRPRTPQRNPKYPRPSPVFWRLMFQFLYFPKKFLRFPLTSSETWVFCQNTVFFHFRIFSDLSFSIYSWFSDWFEWIRIDSGTFCILFQNIIFPPIEYLSVYFQTFFYFRYIFLSIRSVFLKKVSVFLLKEWKLASFAQDLRPWSGALH